MICGQRMNGKSQILSFKHISEAIFWSTTCPYKQCCYKTCTINQTSCSLLKSSRRSSATYHVGAG